MLTGRDKKHLACKNVMKYTISKELIQKSWDFEDQIMGFLGLKYVVKMSLTTKICQLQLTESQRIKLH